MDNMNLKQGGNQIYPDQVKIRLTIPIEINATTKFRPVSFRCLHQNLISFSKGTDLPLETWQTKVNAITTEIKLRKRTESTVIEERGYTIESINPPIEERSRGKRLISFCTLKISSRGK